MFGYVIANRSSLSDEELARYKGCYCGLCRALRLRHGSASRLTLTYDMTFLVELLSSLYEPEEELAELIRLLGACSRDQRHQLITQLQALPSA